MASSSSDCPPTAFPPQHQDTQPGKEYLMVPLPQAISKDYKPSNRLQGKVAVVTGGDSGIGRAVCYCFAMEGATVAFTYVKVQEDIDAMETINTLKKLKTTDAKEPLAIPTDVRFDENCKRVVEEVVEAFGCIDILVNNAGVQFQQQSLEDITPSQFEMTFRTNIFAYFFMARHALKHMREGSSIINTASGVAYLGFSTLIDYSATKGAIVSFTRSLALNLAKKGIRVNGVAPGPIWTPLQVASLTPEQVAVYGTDITAIGRAGQPYEVAPAYVFLASNDASYIIGQFIHPNGGIIVNG